MLDLAHLRWPFFENLHRRFAPDLAAWVESEVGPLVDHADVDRTATRI
jgi:hypothetical protein